MSEMVEVVIDSIRVSLMSQQRMVILREMNNERFLAIWIGTYEADAITLALQEMEVARPLTWDLLKSVIGALGGRVVRVEVVSLREDTFYGNIVIEVNGRQIDVDSRPSDALALAVRTKTPIYVARSVMKSAGITPEEDLQAAPSAESGPEPESPVSPPAAAQSEPEEGSDRLSIFEDFLTKLDKGDKPDPDEPEKE